METIKGAASKAKGPAIAAGLAVASLAGGLVLRKRMRSKQVLGVSLPRSLSTSSLSDLDLGSVAKTVGQTSRMLAMTSKNVCRHVDRIGDQAERFGDQAERLGKILG